MALFTVAPNKNHDRLELTPVEIASAMGVNPGGVVEQRRGIDEDGKPFHTIDIPGVNDNSANKGKLRAVVEARGWGTVD